MRLVALLFAFLVVPTSGCFFPCDIHKRNVTWVQDDVPLKATGITMEYELGDLWGGVARNPDDNKLRLRVYGNESVSHDEMVRFAEALFASKGWPEPRMEGGIEESGCGDDY